MRDWNDLNPKVVASLIGGAVIYVLTHFGVDIDGELEGLITLAASVLSGYFWPEGDPDRLEGIPADVDESGENDDA